MGRKPKLSRPGKLNCAFAALLIVILLAAVNPAKPGGEPVASTATETTTQKPSPRLKNAVQGRDRILICAIGDSVTHGATALGKFDFTNVYHNQLKQLLEKRFPTTIFNMINAGVNGDNSGGGLRRLQRDVLCHKPDLVLIAFGLNDSGGGLEGVKGFKANIQAMIDRITSQTSSDIILMTPNYMATSDNPAVAEEHRKKGYAEILSGRQNAGVLAAYASALRELGAANNIPVADIYAEWKKLSGKVNTNDLLSNGLNHPNEQGHLLAAYAIMDIICPDDASRLPELRASIVKHHRPRQTGDANGVE